MQTRTFNRNRTFFCETTSKRDGTGRLIDFLEKINKPGLLIETFQQQPKRPGRLHSRDFSKKDKPGLLIETGRSFEKLHQNEMVLVF